jgi:hypothetical protein
MKRGLFTFTMKVKHTAFNFDELQHTYHCLSRALLFGVILKKPLPSKDMNW